MKKAVYDKILAIAKRLDVLPIHMQHFYLVITEPTYKRAQSIHDKPFTLDDALSTGTELTSDEVVEPLEVLILKNRIGNTICLFHQGEAYLDGRAIIESESGS